MRLRGKAGLRVVAALASCFLPLALFLGAGASDGEMDMLPADPVDLFDAVFRPIEKAMGIDVKIAGMKMNLLSGQVTTSKITVTHPNQGNFVVAKGVRFPFGAMAGLSDPMKGTVVVNEFNLKLDFSKDKFWKVKTADGSPIPAAPDLKLGKLGIGKGTVRFTDGDSPEVLLSGFTGNVTNLKLPGKLWTKGKVPSSRWVEMEIKGGTVGLTGVPVKILLTRASFHFNSSTFHITHLEGMLEQGGKLTMGGEVDMASGKPKSYDLVVKLSDVPFDRPGLSAIATGSLLVKGLAGNIKIDGKLDLDDVGDLRAGNWSSEGCDDKFTLAVTLAPAEDSGYQDALMQGTLCRGRITTD